MLPEKIASFAQLKLQFRYSEVSPSTFRLDYLLCPTLNRIFLRLLPYFFLRLLPYFFLRLLPYFILRLFLLLSTALPSSSYSLRFPPSHPPYDIDFLFFSPSSLSYSSLSSMRNRYNLDRVRVQEINWHWLTADFGMLSEDSSIYLRTCRISCPR